MQIQKNADGSEYMSFKSDEKDIPITVKFEEGVLSITPKEEKYKEKNKVVYGVFELDLDKKIKDYENKKQNGLIVGADKKSHNGGMSSIKKEK